MHVITQAVVPGQTLIKGHAVFQAEELAVAAGHAVVARFLRTVAVQTRNTVFQRQVLAGGQIQRLAQRQHVVLGVVTQFGTRIAFRHHVERQTVFHLRRGVRQHRKAIAEYAGFAEDGVRLAAADLLQGVVQLCGRANVQAVVQLIVGIPGVQRLCDVADGTLRRHIRIGVFGHGDVNVAVAVGAALGVPHHAGGGDIVRALDITAGKGVIDHDGGLCRTCGKAGIHLHVVANHQVIRFQRTGTAVGIGAHNVVA